MTWWHDAVTPTVNEVGFDEAYYYPDYLFVLTCFEWLDGMMQNRPAANEIRFEEAY